MPEYANLQAVVAELATDIRQGLSREERRRRFSHWGANRLETKSGFAPLWLLLNQFGDVMVLLLLVATLISAALGEYYDAITIIIIVILNALLGFVQEFKAERSLEALQSLNAPRAQVLCQGQLSLVPAEGLVPGDVVFIQAGDRIPADLRIFDSAGLEVEESPLTGESQPVIKGEDGDYLAYMGCLVTRGRSLGIVVATGMNTRMGKIAGLLRYAQQQPTPLQKRLANLGRVLVAVCVAVSMFIMVAGVWRGEALYKMFMAGVSLAVAAIPEGLPAVVTLCLAIGVQRMLKRNAVVRKLPAVETLGSATVICSDKTGTLTQNQMTVEKLYVQGQQVEVTGRGYDINGAIRCGDDMPAPLQWLLTVGALCNGAQLKIQADGRGEITGDPTDGALLVLAAKGGVFRKGLLERYEIVQEYPFDSRKKMMTVVVRDNYSGRHFAMVKGAPEVVLPRCGRVPGEVEGVCTSWAEQALRLLAVAWREQDAPFGCQADAETGLNLAGIVAMDDPPRPEVANAVRQCLRAGIKPMMITGDHRATAVAVARRIRLPLSPRSVVTGEDLEAMDDAELKRRIGEVTVCARVLPEHKMRLVRVLKELGHVVAMTGDGVNDAPAVKEADIGIAMGQAGTEVTKEAASLVLLDDNFATIVAAVEEGRAIYQNIRKFIRFLLTCNAGEIFTMFFAMMLGFPLPLRASQILWVNLVTDGLPALALGMEPAAPGIMQAPPRPVRESVLARGLAGSIFFTGLGIGMLTIMVFAWSLATANTLDYARTMAFATLITLQLVFAYYCRRNDDGSTAPLTQNLWLVAALCFSFALLLAVLYVPVLQMVFATVRLSASDWLIVAGVSLLPVLAFALLERGRPL